MFFLCVIVNQSVSQSVRPSVCPSVRLSLCSVSLFCVCLLSLSSVVIFCLFLLFLLTRKIPQVGVFGISGVFFWYLGGLFGVFSGGPEFRAGGIVSAFFVEIPGPAIPGLSILEGDRILRVFLCPEVLPFRLLAFYFLIFAYLFGNINSGMERVFTKGAFFDREESLKSVTSPESLENSRILICFPLSGDSPAKCPMECFLSAFGHLPRSAPKSAF